MIVVTGATGHFGKTTIDFLLKNGIDPASIVAFVRDEAKAEALKAKGIVIKVGDYNDYASMLEAFHQADKLLLISGTDIANRSNQQQNSVKAAKEAEVKHLVYTSFMRKNESGNSPIEKIGRSHIDTEQHIKASGIPYTIMKNGLYADVLPMFFGEKVLETGIFYPAGDGKAAYTTREDMAEAAANILVGTGHENKEYTIATDHHTDLAELATILSEITGRSVAYLNPGVEVYTDALSKAGVPSEYIGMFAGFAEGIKQGEFESNESDLEKLLGHAPTSIHAYLTSIYHN